MDELSDSDLSAGDLLDDESDHDVAQATQTGPTDDDDGALEVGDDEDYVLEEGRRLLADAEAKLAAVERALARLDSGSYGLCEICNEPIAPTALTERPSLTRCAEHEVPSQ